MVEPNYFLSAAQSNGMSFFTGVPDSLLSPFCSTLAARVGYPNHIIAANEGGAVALAIGHHLATGQLPLVYMQNSGIGNAVNPILSLASAEVYSIPMVLLIGWRGEPGAQDEPQHLHQGKVTPDLLDLMGINFVVLSDEDGGAAQQLSAVADAARTTGRPVALLVQKGTFGKAAHDSSEPSSSMTREGAIETIIGHVNPSAAIVSTTGMASRELFELRLRQGDGANHDFLTVGGMGHASQIAMGAAISAGERPIYCLDGDGAALMHLGALALIGTSKLTNLIHIVINNGVHESVGGQPTVAREVDLLGIASSCGYGLVRSASTPHELQAALAMAPDGSGPAFIEARVGLGRRADVGRPTNTPSENKDAFMAHLASPT